MSSSNDMRPSPIIGWQTPSICAVLVVVVALVASLGPTSIDRTVVTSLGLLVFALGLHVFSGLSGVVSFGHMGFAVIGGYVTAWMTIPDDTKSTLLPDAPAWVRDLNASPFVAIVAAGCVAAIAAAVMAAPLMRLSGLPAGLATVALLFIAENVARGWLDATRGSRGLAGVPATTTRDRMLIAAVLALFAIWIFQRSRYGVRLRASSEDERASEALGVNVRRERSLAFVFSAFVTGVAASLYVQFLGTMTPGLFFIDLTFVVISMVVLGGIGSMSGAVIGCIIVSTLTELLRRAEAGSLFGLSIPERPGLTNLGIAFVLVVGLLVRPNGIMNGREFRLRRPRRRATPERPANDRNDEPAQVT